VLLHGTCTYDVGAIPAFGSELVDKHEADVRGSVDSWVERIGIPEDDGAVSTSLSLQSIKRCVDECGRDSSRSATCDQSAIVRGARNRSAIGLVREEQASKVCAVEEAKARDSQGVLHSEAPSVERATSGSVALRCCSIIAKDRQDLGLLQR
jgi:hypothetical protein